MLSAIGAIAASAFTGIALGLTTEAASGPSSVTRSGLTLQLPPGWGQVGFDPGQPAFSPAIAIGSEEERGTGLVAGKLGSQAAAERMLEGAQAQDGRRVQVRLGRLDAWRYGGLRPRGDLVGTGYLVPTAGGVVVVICHAPRAIRARLAECERTASTLAVRGERLSPLSPFDRSRERLTQVVDTLRSSRSRRRRRLAAADLAPAQVLAAISLQRSHKRAARSVDHISALANGRSLADLSQALRAAAAAYGRLAAAATTSSRSTYREARRAVIREEGALSRELAQATAAS